MIHHRFIPAHPGFGVIAHSNGKQELAVFIPHNGRSRFRPRLAITEGELDQFAEMLVEGLTVTQAAKAMGRDYPYGNAMLQRIRSRLGSQAV